jgi:hypothetical protein
MNINELDLNNDILEFIGEKVKKIMHVELKKEKILNLL